MACIYIFKNKINNKVYIGQTIKNFKDRYLKHLQSVNKKYCKQIYFYKALSKYGIDNFETEILTSGDFNKNLLNDLEKHYIRLYNSNNPIKGYNCNSGGQGGNLYIRTEEIKSKISNSLKGHSYNKNISKSKEHKDKISKSLKEKAKTDIRWSSCKYCIQLTLNGEIIKIFNSTEEASRILKLNAGTIRSIAKKNIKNPICGFKFKIIK